MLDASSGKLATSIRERAESAVRKVVSIDPRYWSQTWGGVCMLRFQRGLFFKCDSFTNKVGASLKLTDRCPMNNVGKADGTFSYCRQNRIAQDLQQAHRDTTSGRLFAFPAATVTLPVTVTGSANKRRW
jgi:hypothetical protein